MVAIGEAMGRAMLDLREKRVAAPEAKPRPAELSGDLLVSHERVDDRFDDGFSMYVAAWPLLRNHPGQEFQSGLFGYGYLSPPLTDAGATTAGREIPTGNQWWTLFLNTGNFKGSVTCFVPFFWSKPTLEHPHLAGMMLDTRPSGPNKAVQMETQLIAAFIAQDSSGRTFARVAPTQFPAPHMGDAPLIHRITAYGRAALWDGVKE